MRLTADTNILVRTTLKDDTDQAESARQLLSRAESIAIPVAVFCELAWVLLRGYRYSREQVILAISQFLEVSVVVTDRPAVEAGLALLARGGDFADGAIAHQGRALGGQVFATFDATARRLLASQGYETVSP